MTKWGGVILFASLWIGLRGSLKERPRYAALGFIVLGAIAYAALTQHTY